MTTYTDERLHNDIKGSALGPQRAAPYLLQVPEESRSAVVSEAHRMMNMSPGWNYSGAISEIVRQYLRNPDAFNARLEKQRQRTSEVLAWEREHHSVASPYSFEGQPGDPIYVR